MPERMICLDINLEGKDLDRSERIRQRVATRNPKKGGLYYRDENRRSSLIGGEERVLLEIAAERVSGEVFDVDGIYTGGINIAARVSPQEAERLKQNPQFRVSVDRLLP